MPVLIWAARNKLAAFLLLLLAVLAVSWRLDRARQYRSGVADGKAAVYAEVSEAHALALERTIVRERQAAAALAAAQARMEEERQDAQTAMDNLRAELGRVRQYAARQSSRAHLPAASGTAAAPDEASARGWQLFGHCTAEYAAVAEVADRQRNDLAEWQAYGRVVAGYRNNAD